MLRVRAGIDHGNAEVFVKIKRHFTVWSLKVLVFRQIPIKPQRQSLLVTGESKEMENGKMLKDYPAVFAENAVVNVVDRKEDGKKKKGDKRFKLFRLKKFKELVAPKLCFAHGPGLEQGLVGCSSKLTIHAVEKDYQFCAPKDLRIFEVSVTNAQMPDEHTVLQFDSDEKGNVVVSWVPSNPGMYAIIIRLYGDDILFSPYIVQIEDHENSGKKLQSFLKQDSWRVQAIAVLADWASKEEFHKTIFNDIGVPCLLGMLNAEPQEIVRPAMARVFDGLLSNDTGKRRLIEEGGPRFLKTLSFIGLTCNSSIILRFASRALASQATLYTTLKKDPRSENSDQVAEFESQFDKEMLGYYSVIMQESSDVETIRCITRAAAALAELAPFRALLANADYLTRIGKIVFKDDTLDLSSSKSIQAALTSRSSSFGDMATMRYALRFIANFASDESFRQSFFKEEHVLRLLSLFQPYTQDAVISGAIRALGNLAASEAFCATIVDHSRFNELLHALSGTDSQPDWEVSTSLHFLPSFANKDDHRRRLTAQFHGDQEFNYAGVKLLRNIIEISHNGEVRAKICSGSTIDNLVTFTMSSDLALQNEACTAVATLSLYEDGREAIIAKGGVNALCTALNTSNDEAAAHVVEALAQMPLQVKDVLVNVIGDSGIDKLINLLEQKELQRGAAILLASLAGDESCVSRIVKKGGQQFMTQLIMLVQKGQVQVQCEIAPHEVNCEKVVGEGISGVVWKGTWRDQVVAVKTFDEEGLAFCDAEFRSEVALMSVLRHENIVHCMGSCTQPGNLFIVSELFTRGSVATVVKNKDVELPIQRVCQMALDSAKGMRYLHRLGIIHRDLKAGNLLVNEAWQVKVADFGVSRMNDSKMTRGVGTPVYTAPEALAGSDYSLKADVYSFAFVVWELVTRDVPYKDYAPFEAVRLACDENLRPEIPENCVLETLIENCWDRDPSKRPSFDDIVSALTELCSIVAGADNKSSEAQDASDDAEEEEDRYVRANRILTQMGTLRPGGRSRSGARGRAGQRPSSASLAAPEESKKGGGFSSADTLRSEEPARVPVVPSAAQNVPVADRRSTSKLATARKSTTKRKTEVPKRKTSTPGDRVEEKELELMLDGEVLETVKTPVAPTDKASRAKGSLSRKSGQGLAPSAARTAGGSLRKKKPTAGGSIRGLNKAQLAEMVREMEAKTGGGGGGAAPESAAVKAINRGGSIRRTKKSVLEGIEKEMAENAEEKMVSCARCGEQLTEKRALAALGSHWHSKCFVCAECGSTLTTGWKRHEGKPYCKAHIPNVKRCGKCDEPLTTSYVNALGKSWHANCFVCSVCECELDAFVDLKGKPVCEGCYQQL